MRPSDRRVWMALVILAWFVIVFIIAGHLDTGVTCSNNAPC